MAGVQRANATMCRALAHDHGGRDTPAPAAPRADPARTVEPHLPGHARVRCGTRHSDHQPRVKGDHRKHDGDKNDGQPTAPGAGHALGDMRLAVLRVSIDAVDSSVTRPTTEGRVFTSWPRAGTGERAPRQTTRYQRSWAPRRFHPRPLRGPVFIPLNTRGSIGALCVTVSYPMIVAWNFRQILCPRPSRCRGS
jgi:hypothetical protein